MSVFDFDRPIDRRGTGSNKWSRYAPDVLPLWVADMDFAVAPAITAALRRRLDHPVFGYGVARDGVRDAVLAMLEAEHGWRVAPEAICFLPGVEPGFNMALKSLVEPGLGVVVQTPAYRPMLTAPGHWGLPRIDAPLTLRDGRVTCDMAALRQALRGAGALLFCNPHNPLGKVFTPDELREIGQAALAAGALVISDEIHAGLVLDGRAHVPIASLDPAIAARSVTLMSASKTWNIAGLKTAFAIVPDAGLREKFLGCKAGMVDSVNIMGLEATEAALTEGGPWRRALLAYLQGNRDWLVEAVRARLPGITMHAPEGTFLGWMECRGLALGAEPAAWFLDHARVAFSAGSEFGAADCLRFNFGCSRATLSEAVARMEAALAAR